MTDLTYKIGTFDAEARIVPVIFSYGDRRHKRNVNAVTKEDGSYDRAATKKRVAEVAQGVAHKFALGVIGSPPPAAVEAEDDAAA